MMDFYSSNLNLIFFSLKIDSIAKHFQFSENKMETMWKLIRSKLNVKLACRRRSTK